jgi:hypothetical protein
MASINEEVPLVIEERETSYNEDAVQAIMKQSPEELYKQWNVWDDSKPLIERDNLIEAMKRLGLYPDNPIEGVYPDPMDPSFAERLFAKKEFADLQSTASEEDDLCNASYLNEFDKSAVRQFVARFMNPSTPYTSALLYHGVGVGKTCTAITIAEKFLDILPDKKVIILAPPAIADSFHRTIFNSNRLVKLQKKDRDLLGRRWDSPQCTGLAYLSLSDMLYEKDTSKITKEVDKLIKRRYMIMGYGVFANYVKKQILGRVPAHLSEEERIRLENEEIFHTFSDHLIIVDEVHNLRDEGRRGGDDVDGKGSTDLAEGKLVRSILERIIPNADGMRLLLMTATPMYNISTEIIGLLNLLIINDTKDASAKLNFTDFFTKKGKDFEMVKGSEEKLTKIAQRYISYMRGEHPSLFPLRLSPPDIFNAEYPTITMNKQTLHMNDTVKNILKTLPIVPTIYTPDTTAGRVLQTSMERYHKSGDSIEGEEGEINKTLFSSLVLQSNIIYPDGSSGNDGFRHYFAAEEFGESPRLRRFRWSPRGESEITIDSVFGPSMLHQYAPKIATILASLKTCKGIGFVYSRAVSAGVIPFGIALERAGWSRVLASGRIEPLLHEAPPLPYGRQCALCEHHEKDHKEEHEFQPAKFVLLAGEDKFTPSVDASVQYAQTFPKEDPMAPYGSHVKLIVGSGVAREGLDFKCIREIHLLDPWWHLNRIEQIVGRGVRFCSHTSLPKEERNCTLYFHIAQLSSDYETPDMYAYRLAAEKSIQIGIIQRAIKIGALDCNNHQSILFIDPSRKRTIRNSKGITIKDYSLADKQYSSICDFMDNCTYKCYTELESSKIGSDQSTYKVDDLMRHLEVQFNKIKAYFQNSNTLYISLKDIKDEFFKDVSWELVALGLRRKLNNASFMIEQADGTRGTLLLQNGFLVFQPLHITAPEIPLALRHGYAYGRLATRIISPLHATGERTLTSIASSSGETELRITKSLEERSLLRLEEWQKEITALANPTHANDMKRKVPDGMQEEIYRLLQWMPYRFRDFLYIEKILLQFYMDRIWSLDERHAVLTAITERRGTGTTTPLDDLIISNLSNPEIFDVDGIYGFTSITKTGEELRYCKVGSNPVGICPPSIIDLINPILDTPVNGIDRCAPIYGFHVFYKTAPLFKILNTEKLNARNRVFTGSNCTITSNLDRMLEDVTSLYKYQKEYNMTSLLPMIFDIRKVKETAEPFTYLDQLKSPQLCMYSEILLRAFQAIETEPRRWILSMVDAKRAVEVTTKKGKEIQKAIFQNSFAFITS